MGSGPVVHEVRVSSDAAQVHPATKFEQIVRAPAVKTDLEVPPHLLRWIEGLDRLLELRDGHLREIVVVHDGPAPCLAAADDVAAGRVCVLFSVDAVPQINAARATAIAAAQRCDDSRGSWRRPGWKA
jgi:hypothetical protein